MARHPPLRCVGVAQRGHARAVSVTTAKEARFSSASSCAAAKTAHAARPGWWDDACAEQNAKPHALHATSCGGGGGMPGAAGGAPTATPPGHAAAPRAQGSAPGVV
jgi:hypothetical protein